MNFEGWISYRYLRGNKDRFVSLINAVTITGIAIGVTALIIVIGVMSGFDEDLKGKIVGTNAHVLIEKETGLRNFEIVRKKVSGIDGVEATSAYVHGHVFLEENDQATGLVLRGIVPQTEKNVTKIKDYLVKGHLNDVSSGNTIIIGSELARYFGYQLGDKIVLIAPGSGLAGQGWRHQMTIVGIFTSGMYDYDMNLVLTNIPKAQEVFHLPKDTVTGIALKLKNIYAAPEIKKKIYETIGYSFLVRTWIESNRNFFAALRLEKFSMFIILTLIVLVASFNIVSTLIVTVTSKIKDIGILKSIGVPSRSIRRIFTLQGIFLGVLGTFWGLFGGIGLSLLLKKYQFVKLPPEIYYIDRLPVLLKLSDILIIIGSAIFISYLATLYPASKAARLEPVDALRYE